MRAQKGTAGQAAIELALCLPMLALLLMGVIQVGLMVREQLHLEFTVREAARVAARSADPDSAATEISTAMLRRAPTEISINILPGPHHGTEMIRVQIVVTAHSSVPLIGGVFKDRRLQATATMAREPP